MDYSHGVHMFITLVSVVNPLGIIPVFLAITSDQTPQQKRATIRRTVIAVMIILLASAYIGNALLAFFGIDINSFRIAGGVLLLLMGVHMLQAKMSTVVTNQNEQNEAKEKEDVSVVPLAIPLLAGPGAMGMVILFSTDLHSTMNMVMLGVIIVIVALLILPILMLSDVIGKYLGATGLNIATRIMGLILASIAVKFMLEGVVHALKSIS